MPMRRLFQSRTVYLAMIAVIACVTTLGGPILAATHPLDTSDQQVADALDYLRSQQASDGAIGDFATTAWAAMAIASAGEDPGSWAYGGDTDIVDYLAVNADGATSCTDYARMVLAIVASGEDPTYFGGRDFVALLFGTFDGSQMGDTSFLNDDFWAVMALASVGDTASTASQETVAFILANQNTDGGWSWGTGQASDVDDTASAIMALRAAGESDSSVAVQDGLSYLESMQMENGGFESWGATNSATNAWVIASLAATNEDPTSTRWTTAQSLDPVDDLLTFQNVDGSFNWTSDTPSNMALMTSYAIPALLGEPYPVVVDETALGTIIGIRIESPLGTVWSGTVTVDETTIEDDQGGEHVLANPTALGALHEASQAGGFDYVVQDTAYGLYVYSIDGQEPAGLAGWMFRADYESPMVGAADFVLGETTPPNAPHGEILFAYSVWGDKPLRVEADITEPAVGEEFTITVDAYDDTTGDWSPCEGATVYAGGLHTTAEDGTVAVTIDSNTTIEVYAEKDACIRSNRVTVTVGEGGTTMNNTQVVGLTTEIIPAVSFSLSPETIDFGQVGPRESSAPQTITITNLGAWDLIVTAEVSADPGGLYENGLMLDAVAWSEFSRTLPRDADVSCSAVVTVPETYSLVGPQPGTIVFWATDAEQ